MRPKPRDISCRAASCGDQPCLRPRSSAQTADLSPHGRNQCGCRRAALAGSAKDACLLLWPRPRVRFTVESCLPQPKPFRGRDRRPTALAFGRPTAAQSSWRQHGPRCCARRRRTPELLRSGPVLPPEPVLPPCSCSAVIAARACAAAMQKYGCQPCSKTCYVMPCHVMTCHVLSCEVMLCSVECAGSTRSLYKRKSKSSGTMVMGIFARSEACFGKTSAAINHVGLSRPSSSCE